MPDNTYPKFESGQTLTATDLNLLPAFLHERDRLIGRMVGFGINAGLAGSVSGTTLTITPGLAVDQYGEPLVLGAPQAVTLPPTPVTPSYDFITPDPGGFSVVLEATDTIDPVPACGEAGCAGHAEHHTRSVTLRVVAGRVTGTRLDFAEDDLLKPGVEPVRVGLDASPINSYQALRDAVATRLTNAPGAALVTPSLITKLRGTSVAAGDSPAVRGYTCGWLNLVFFATLDLVRCEALMELTANRNVARAGVVLGWVRQVSGTWVFECGWRHAWEPPRGFSEAFLGGTCADPCSIARDRVEALIDGYAPPDPPPPSTDPKPPELVCPKGWIRVNGHCWRVQVPPKWEFDWRKDWEREVNPLDPIWNPPPFEDPGWLVNPEIIYEQPPIDFLDDGVIGGLQYVGFPADGVKGVLETHINDHGGLADVRVLGAADAQALPGFEPASAFSGSDTVVLVTGSDGTVVGTGRVAAVHNTKRVATALPQAQAAAAEATQAVKDAGAIATGIQDQFSALQGQVTGLGTQFQQLQGEFDGYRGGQFDQAGYGTRIQNLEQSLPRVVAYGDRIASLEGQVEVLARTGTVKGLTPGYGRGLAEFTETAVAAVRALETQNPHLQRYVKDVERAHAQFEVDVASGDPEVIGAAALGVIRSMRTMVKSSLKDTREGAALGSQLDAQVRNLERLFG